MSYSFHSVEHSMSKCYIIVFVILHCSLLTALTAVTIKHTLNMPSLWHKWKMIYCSEVVHSDDQLSWKKKCTSIQKLRSELFKYLPCILGFEDFESGFICAAWELVVRRVFERHKAISNSLFFVFFFFLFCQSPMLELSTSLSLWKLAHCSGIVRS